MAKAEGQKNFGQSSRSDVAGKTINMELLMERS